MGNNCWMCGDELTAENTYWLDDDLCEDCGGQCECHECGAFLGDINEECVECGHDNN